MKRNPHSIKTLLAALGSLVLAALPASATVNFSNGYTGTFSEASNASGTAYQANVITTDLINGMTPSITGWNTAGGASPNRLTDGLNGANDNSGGQVEGGWTTVGASATYTLGTGANGLGYNVTSIQSIASWPNAGFGNQGWTVSVRLPGGTSFTNVGSVNYQPFTTSGGSSTRVVLNDLSITGIDAIRFTASQVNNGTNAGAFVWREIDVVGASTPASVDSIPPALVSLTPRNNSGLAPAGVSLAALFDEAIALGTGTITITNTTTGQPMVLTLPDARVSVSARTLVIQPGLLVTPSAHYAVRVGSGVVVDPSGNAFTGINDDTTWNFTSAAPAVEVTDVSETAYLNDANPADLLQGRTATTTGWNTANGAHPSKLTDGSGGLSFVDAGNTVDGAWTTVGATAVYQLGAGTNGTGYDIFSLQSIASWANVAFGNQAWTLEVKPVNGSYTSLMTVNYQPLTTVGSTKMVMSGASGTLASGIEAIRITASQVNGGVNAGAFVWRELDVFGHASAASVNDGQPPVLVSLVPATQATGVTPDSALVATFDKNIVAGTGSLHLRNLDTAQETAIPVADSRISFSGKKLTITPSSRLSSFTRYAVRIDAGAVTDFFSNAFAGIADDTTWRFTTGKVRLRIMPMGDSITAGYTDNPSWNEPHWYGYRSGLYNRLHAADYHFVFVGQSLELSSHVAGTTPPADLATLGQNAHNGYGGQTASFLNANILNWLATDNPDVILLHIGTNSADRTGLDTLVQTIVSTKPDLQLLVARIIPRYSYDQTTTDYNDWIRDTLVPKYQAMGKKVTLVDQYANFLTNPANNTTINQSLFSNGINHPNNPGYDLMAAAWFNALEALGLNALSYSDWIADPAFGIAVADRGFSSDPDGDGISNGLEAWFGTDPGKPDSGSWISGPLILTDDTNGKSVSFTHPVNEKPVSGLLKSYQWSTDLAEWYSADGAAGPSGGLHVTCAASVSGTTASVMATPNQPTTRLFLRPMAAQP
ncbi:MAG: Ig-like domain-containing protein [Verrucomicrobiota bacterium]